METAVNELRKPTYAPYDNRIILNENMVATIIKKSDKLTTRTQ